MRQFEMGFISANRPAQNIPLPLKSAGQSCDDNPAGYRKI